MNLKMKNRTDILTNLRQRVVEIERESHPQSGAHLSYDQPDMLSFGNEAIDNHLGGGLLLDALHEVRCSATREIASACALICQLLIRQQSDKPIIWIIDPAVATENFNLYPDGLEQLGIAPSRFILVKPANLNDAIWAIGEIAKTGGISAAIFQVKGNPKSFDLPVSRKLMLRTQHSGTPIFILRQAGEEEASSAITRWHVQPKLSLPDQSFHQGIGDMRLSLILERNRNGQTKEWLVAWNPKTRSLENAAENSEAAHSILPLYPFANGQNFPPQVGQVMALGKAS